MTHGTVLRGLKTSYAMGARRAGRALVGTGLMGLHAPERDARIRHWLHSLWRVHDPLAMAELDVPWWTYRAIDVVDAWLAGRRGAVRVFEYGSGSSTMWLSRRTSEVHSVEHHAAFAEQLRAALADHPNVHLRTVEPIHSAEPAVPSSKEGYRGLDFADYVNSIETAGGKFDLVVIDGRAREACLSRALPFVAEDGVLVFDNSRRRRYRRAIAAAPVTERRLAGLTPTLPYPEQTSLLSPVGTMR
jgi:Methyltransferase domain